MNRYTWLLAMTGTALLLGACERGPTSALAQDAIVIEGATLIDGNGGAPVDDSAIVIEGNRITAVGQRGEVQGPNGARVIDATGKFVVPGFIDAKSNHASNFNEAFLVWGVTSAICSGCSGDAGIAERDAINAGIVRGPRLFVSFGAIQGVAPGGEARPSIPSSYRYEVNTPQEAHELAVQFFEAGADFISSGNGDAPPELYQALVDEAKRRGRASVMRSVGPLTAAPELADMGVEVAIHAGQACLRMTTDETTEKWANYIALPPDCYSDMDDAKAEALAAYLAERGLALEPDNIAMDRGFLTNWDRIQEENARWYQEYLNTPALRAYYPERQVAGYVENVKSPETYLTPEQLDVRRRGYENKMRFLKMFADAGGRLLTASDIPQSPPGLGVHQEMAAFVEDVGLTPMEAILGATGWAADAFILPDRGRIEEGKLADLIILNADPTADILATREIDTVIKDGEVVDRSYHADALDNSFKLGMMESGACCFSSPIVEGGAWLNSLKQATWRPTARNGGWGNTGGIDSAVSPTPGIEMIMPYVIDVGSPETTVTLTGFNYVNGSQVLVNGEPVPTDVVSRTEIHATLSTALLSNPGRYVIRVRNPEPIATAEWGDTSNPAKITVPTQHTQSHSNNRF